MAGLKWEIFEDYINRGYFSVCESNCLSLPIKRFAIKRDKNLDIFIETECEPNIIRPLVTQPKGTIYQSSGIVNFQNIAKNLVVASGVEILSWPGYWEARTNITIQYETASIHKISCQIQEESEGKYLIEWLANVDDSYIFPDATIDEFESTFKRTVFINNTPLTLVMNGKSGGGAKGVGFSVDGLDLYLSTAQDVAIEKEKKPGYIVYRGIPPEKMREKIRTCISFVYGRPFVYLGHTIFDSNWRLVSFEAISPHNDMDGKAYDLHTMPPAPLYSLHRNMIDKQIFSDMINSLYKKYEECNFRHVSWLYWHAVAAPLHIAATHFGATIEAVQKAFIKANKNSIDTKLLGVSQKSLWESLRKNLLGTLSKSTIDNESIRKVLENKINSLNEVPKGLAAERFLEKLNIILCDIEKKSWSQRNQGAHGDEPENENYIDVIKQTKILRILCNRIILKLLETQKYYFDYYTIDFPIKNLEDHIG